MKEAAEQLLSLSSVDTRLGAFLREYFVNNLTRVAMNVAFLKRLIQPNSRYLDVGSFGIEAVILKKEYPSCTVKALAYEGNNIGIGPEGFFETVDAREAGCILIDAVDVERESFPYQDNEFDLVTCFEVLEHLKHSPIPMVKEIKRVLHPEGLLVLTTPNINSARSLVKMFCGRSPQQCPYYHESLQYGVMHAKEYTQYEVEDLLTSLGLKIEKLSTVDMRPTGFPERALVALLSALIPIIRRFSSQAAYPGGLHEKILVVAMKGGPIISETPQSLFEPRSSVRPGGHT